MHSKVILMLIGIVAVAAQGSTPRPITPKKAQFTELTAYNLAGYTPQ